MYPDKIMRDERRKKIDTMINAFMKEEKVLCSKITMLENEKKILTGIDEFENGQ